jgi:hypothetical protein
MNVSYDKFATTPLTNKSTFVPRKLPFGKKTFVKDNASFKSDDTFEDPVQFYTYASPMEKEIQDVRSQLSLKESEIELTQKNLDSLLETYPQPEQERSGKNVCSNCHLKGISSLILHLERGIFKLTNFPTAFWHFF